MALQAGACLFGMLKQTGACLRLEDQNQLRVLADEANGPSFEQTFHAGLALMRLQA
jgi:hypothetical protein